MTIIAVIMAATGYAQEDWAKFERYAAANDTVKTAPKAVLMGDSITDGWARQRPDFFSANNFLGRGISGQTASQMLCRFQNDVVAHSPKVVVILAGTNDIAHNNGWASPENVVSEIKSMCDIARANKIVPVICSVLPCNYFRWRKEMTPAQDIIALNKALKKLADDEKIVYVDYHSAMAAEDGSLPAEYTKDGCHPIAAGYEVMEKIIVPHIDRAAKRRY